MALTKVDDRGLNTPIDLLDNEKIRLGSGNDLEIYHNSTSANIINTTGLLKISAGSSANYIQSDSNVWITKNNAAETMAKFSGDGAVELYYDNSKKFETTANGVAVSNIQNNFGLDLNGVGNNTCIRFMSTGSSPNRGYKINFHSATNVFNAPALTFDRTATDGTHSAHLAGISDDGFHLPDNLKLHLGSTGASGDLQIYHDGSTASILKAKAGDQLSLQADTIWFRNAANSETTAKFLGDGAVELYYDNSKKFETTAAGVTVTGETTTSSFTVNGNQLVGNGNSTGNQIKFARSGLGDELVIGTDGYGNSTQYEATIQSSIVAARPLVFRTNNTDRLRILGGGDIQIPVDNKKLQIGAGQDLEIYHDAQHSRLKSKTGNLFIHTTDSGEIGAEFKQNGSVDLYYDHSKKFETTSSGATVTGTVTATAFSGDGIIPAGGIIIWSGASNAIPTGWLLCNGSNSTPDLRDRFVVGAGSTYSVGATGGANSVTLTIAQMPNHSHPIQIRTGVDDDNFSFNQGFSSDSNTSGGTFNSNTEGGGGSHENRPPYYALCYIMKS